MCVPLHDDAHALAGAGVLRPVNEVDAHALDLDRRVLRIAKGNDRPVHVPVHGDDGRYRFQTLDDVELPMSPAWRMRSTPRKTSGSRGSK